MNCQEFVRRLQEIQTHGPETLLPEELQQHHAECHDCMNRVQQATDTWLLLSAALARPHVTSEFEARVIDQITATTTQTADDATAPESRLFVIGKYALAASVLIVLLLGTSLITYWSGPNSPAATSDMKRIKEFARQLGKLQEIEAAFAAPDVRYVSLSTAEPAGGTRGYILYDVLAKEGHYFGYGLIQKEDRGVHALHLAW